MLAPGSDSKSMKRNPKIPFQIRSNPCESVVNVMAHSMIQPFTNLLISVSIRLFTSPCLCLKPALCSTYATVNVISGEAVVTAAPQSTFDGTIADHRQNVNTLLFRRRGAVRRGAAPACVTAVRRCSVTINSKTLHLPVKVSPGA